MSATVDAGGRIVVADDDAAVLRTIRLILIQAGHTVGCASTAAEAAQLLARQEWDLVITDIRMPGNEDLAFLREQEARASLVPVIIITGHPSVETAVEAIRLRVLDYIQKPFEPEQLLERVHLAIQKGRALRQVHAASRHAANLADWLSALTDSLQMPGAKLPEPTQAPTSPPAPAADPLLRLAPEELSSLSPREREVLESFAQGHRVADISKTLDLSPHTTRNHLKSIFAKLRVGSQVELTRKLGGG